MKLNYIGIAGALIAFISLVLPWWTLTIGGYGVSASAFNLNMYNLSSVARAPYVELNSWYDWVAVLLVVLAGVLGFAGSIIQNGKMLLFGGGLTEALAIIIFSVDLQIDLWLSNSGLGLFSKINIFTQIGRGAFTESTYLNIGFWLALISAIVMFVGAMKTMKAYSRALRFRPATHSTD